MRSGCAPIKRKLQPVHKNRCALGLIIYSKASVLAKRFPERGWLSRSSNDASATPENFKALPPFERTAAEPREQPGLWTLDFRRQTLDWPVMPQIIEAPQISAPSATPGASSRRWVVTFAGTG